MTQTSGHTAVMSMRAPTNPDDLDFFPTPPWAARAGGELIKALDPDAKTCWEPACGEGHMAYALEDYFAHVWKSDIHDYGGNEVRDFLDDADVPHSPAPDWIITNPPFIKGAEFVRLGLQRATRGVAMLLRLAFLEGQERYKLLYGDTPVTIVAPYAERVPMVKGRWDPKASSATAYGWFIWLQPGVNPYRQVPIIQPIAPGAKARLTKSGDAQRFGAAAETPLFGGTHG